jgi:hypothetical protein
LSLPSSTTSSTCTTSLRLLCSCRRYFSDSRHSSHPPTSTGSWRYSFSLCSRSVRNARTQSRMSQTHTTTHQPHFPNYVDLVLVRLGWITLNCYTTASLNVPQRDLGVAIGLVGTFRSVGGSIGSVIFSSIFAQTAEKEVAKRIAATATADGVASPSFAELMEAVTLTLLGVPGQAAKISNVPTEVFESCVRAGRYGYAYAFRITWLASIPFGAVALLAAVVVRDPSKYFTNHVEVRLEKKRGVARKTQ